MDIGSGCRIALTATLDKTNPRGVHIGAGTEVSSRARILAHDSVHIQHVDTRIGERCHIGFGAVISPPARLSCATSQPVASSPATLPGWSRKTSGPENTA
jgi:acetyltransferase-like isoleucine patch superfamily enzyme